MSGRAGPAARLLLVLVRLYQLVPKGATPRCRFAPSCSEYAAEALRLHGAVRGLWLAARRLVRCHPFNPGGVDRVPQPEAAGSPPPREGVTV